MLAQPAREGGAFAGFAGAFANMADEIRAKKRRRQEMEAAAAIQESILPQPLSDDAASPAVDLYAEMHPAREIGGGFFLYFSLPGGPPALPPAHDFCASTFPPPPILRLR